MAEDAGAQPAGARDRGDRAGAGPAGARVRCAGCGFDSADLPVERFRAVLDGHVAALADALGPADAGPAGDAAARRRPDPDTWSALEYAGHLADVLELFDRRIAALLSAPDPVLEVLDHDRVVRERGHNQVAVPAALDRLRRAAAAIGATADRLHPDQLDRAGHRAGERRTVREVLHRGAHEAAHHAGDVRRLLARPAPGAVDPQTAGPPPLDKAAAPATPGGPETAATGGPAAAVATPGGPVTAAVGGRAGGVGRR